MEIKLYNSEDFEIDEIDEATGCYVCPYKINDLDGRLSLRVYTFLTSSRGVALINHLRAKKNLIVICQVQDPSRTYDFVRVVLSGEGLMMQCQQNGKILEDPVSCTFACYAWRHYKTSLPRKSTFFGREIRHMVNEP